MIRINLVKKERKGITLPDLSKLRRIQLKDILKERAILIVPAIGAVLIAGEIYYVYQLKQEINLLKAEVNRLTMERNNLKRKADQFIAKRRSLEREINAIKTRIKYIEMSKDVILVLKSYYKPFNYALGYLQSSVPSTVWYDSLSQNMDFRRINVELRFGSYDIDSIKNFYSLVKREFSQLMPGEIKKRENKAGIIYYVSSVQVKKELTGGEE